MRKEACAFMIFVLLSLLDAGCMGIVPLAKKTKSPLETTSNPNTDFTFIHVGETGRAEVEQRLGALDTGLHSPQFFLGRWSSSSLGGFCFAPGPGRGGCAGVERVWKNSNLLVEFDDKGIVKTFQVFTDSQLVRKLGPVAGAQKPLDSSQSAELSVHRHKQPGTAVAEFIEGKIVLHSDSLEFVETPARGKPLHLTVGAEKVKKVNSAGEWTAQPIYAYVGIHFFKNPKELGGRSAGDGAYYRMTLPDLVTLLNFISQSHTVPAGNASKPDT
jgi:hypothetical protein